MQTHFIRTYDSPYGIDRVDPASIYYLFDRYQTVTSLILDTNVLIDMEKIVRGGNHAHLLKEHRISELVNLLNSSAPASVNITPGIAFYEIPQSRIAEVEWFYQQFCAKHLPNWGDTPDCQPIEESYSEPEPVTIHNLTSKHRDMVAVTYCLMLKIIMLYKSRHLNAREKFDAFFDYACNQLNMLSFKEIEVAKYCFFDQLEPNESKPEFFKSIRDNFIAKGGKNPQTFESAARIALNSAFDLILLESPALMLRAKTQLAGYNQDYWLVSYDGKLKSFSERFRYDVSRGVKGAVWLVRDLPIYEKSDWFYFDHKHMTNNWARAILNEGDSVDTDKSIREIEQTALSFFGE